MFTDKSKQHIVSAISNQELADDLELRLSVATPADAAEATATLASYKQPVSRHREYLTVALCQKEAGDEIADRLQAAENVLKAVANGEETLVAPAEAAAFEGQVVGMTTDVTIEADVPGAAGNDIILEFDGIVDIDAALLAWNTANSENTASLTAGDGSQIPDNAESIQLADGLDADFEDQDLGPSLTALSQDPLTASTKERLTIAFCDQAAASEFSEQFDSMVSEIWDLD